MVMLIYIVEIKCVFGFIEMLKNIFERVFTTKFLQDNYVKHTSVNINSTNANNTDHRLLQIRDVFKKRA